MAATSRAPHATGAANASSATGASAVSYRSGSTPPTSDARSVAAMRYAHSARRRITPSVWPARPAGSAATMPRDSGIAMA